MFSLETLRIDLNALTGDSLEKNWVLDDEYFSALQDVEIQRGNVNVEVTLHKAENYFDLQIRTEGHVVVTCDRCLDEMEQPVKSDSRFIVKLGIANGEDDDTITVDENEGMLDLPWIVYESIALSVPIKHVHAPGKCNTAMTEKLEELSATRSGDGTDDTAVDPRWSKLTELKEKY